MPDITVTHIALMAVAALLGVIAGWVFRGNRSSQEKAAINAGWQEQIEAQRLEHERLVQQNTHLMDQISQLQASNRDAKNRAKELSIVVQEAFERRDELQREIKDIRGNLEVAVTQRDKLKTDMAAHDDHEQQMKQKDDKIVQLSRELENWQDRLPPLIERFRARNEEAEQFEAELEQARAHIRELQRDDDHNQTRIEPVHDPDALTDGRDASNDPLEIDAVESMAVATDATSEPGTDSVESLNDSPVNTLRDDLKRIKGVGPAIEKTLNEIGIFRFQQIANMSEYDIDRVAQRLKGFHSRIYREDWIGQARDLDDRKQGA